VGDREFEYDELVVATGSVPALPPLDGLDDVEFWTNREAIWASSIPRSLVVLGGGAVGVELAQFFRRVGAEVTLVEHNEHLLARLDADAGALLAERFEQDGIRVLVGARAASVERDGSGIRVSLEGGDSIEAERILVATGRHPDVADIGLEQLGVEVTRRGVTVDERLRAGDRVWAIGDASGVGLLTHLGKYQARVAAANIVGHDVRADYRAIPAAVFSDPQVASVGRMDGDGVATARYEITGGRLSTYERPRRVGFVKVAADRAERVLVGAVAVGPEAGEWLGQLTLAVRAQVRIDVLLDTIQPYPTFSEAIFNAVRELATELDG
jgi:dihydrolipoamide dehydrogenase